MSQSIDSNSKERTPMTSSPRSTARRLLFPASGLIAVCAFLHACGGGGGGGGGAPPPNPAPPPTTFVSTSQFPTNSAANVPLSPLILLGFNDTVNPATVIGANVFLTQGVAVVPSTVSYLACSNQVQLLPTAQLLASTQYTINLATGLQDDDGESITAITFTFTTGANTDGIRPVPDAGPPTGVPNPGTETTEIMLTWLDASDNTSAAGAISYRVYQSAQPPCFDYSSPVVITGPGILQAVVPGLTPRTQYSFVVRAVDAQNNESLNTNAVSVTTGTSFITNVYPLVAGFCTACHNPPNGQAWMNTPQITMNYTTPATVYQTWVNQTPSWPAAAGAGMLRVDPGNPANSFLWNKISQAVPVAGVQMPFGQAPLSAANQDIIFDWITEGALDN